MASAGAGAIDGPRKGVASGAAVVAAGSLREPAPGFAMRFSAALEAERDRFFYWLPVALGAGIAFYFALAVEPSATAALAVLAAAAALRLATPRTTLVALLTAALLAAALGFALAKARTERVRAPVLERTLVNAEVKGVVELVEARATRGQRLTLEVISLGALPPDRTPARVRVRVMQDTPGIKPGDVVRLKATLAPPAIPALPGAYDFARQAWFQRLGGIGYALQKGEIVEGERTSSLRLQLKTGIEAVRQSIGARVAAALPGESGAIARALVTGERGAISAATNDAYRDSGLFHILSISGLHMAIMAGAVFVSVRFLLALYPPVALRAPIKKWAAAAAAIAALGYLMISGSEFATVRAFIMISIMFLAVLLDRPALALRNVAATALVILAVSPESLNDVGFQMSFAAVVALVAVYEELRAHAAAKGFVPGPHHRVALFFGGIVLSTLVASLAVAPFAAYYFHKSQQFAILANLVAIPVCNLVVMPAALASLVAMPFGLEALPLAVMGWGIEAMGAVASYVAALPGAVGRIPAISPAAFALMVAGGLALCLVRQRARIAGLALVATGIALAPLRAPPDILIGNDGRLVAARGHAGTLSALDAPQSAFELSRWLEHDGDARTARQAVAAAAVDFACDGAGCVGKVDGLTLAVARRPAALADDCERADILVLAVPKPSFCATKARVVDAYAVRDDGTHAIYLRPGEPLRIETVREHRGARPWVRPRYAETSEGRERSARMAAGRAGTDATAAARVGRFAAPPAMAEALGHMRPELEDEDDAPLLPDAGAGADD